MEYKTLWVSTLLVLLGGVQSQVIPNCKYTLDTISSKGSVQYCYTFEAASNFNDAKQTCLARQGTLAIDRYNSIHTVLQNAMSAEKVTEAWLGAEENVGNWGFVNGEALGTYNNWNTNEPSSAGNCASMVPSTGKWQAQQCVFTLNYICERVTALCQTSDSTKKEFQYNGKCYSIHFNQLNWLQAEASCKSEAGSLMGLISITDAGLMTEVSNQLQSVDLVSNRINGFWIGLTKVTWQWVDNTKVSNSFWEASNPVAGSGQCMALKQFIPNSTPEWLWVNAECTTTKMAICQIENIVYPATTGPPRFTTPAAIANIVAFTTPPTPAVATTTTVAVTTAAPTPAIATTATVRFITPPAAFTTPTTTTVAPTTAALTTEAPTTAAPTTAAPTTAEGTTAEVTTVTPGTASTAALTTPAAVAEAVTTAAQTTAAPTTVAATTLAQTTVAQTTTADTTIADTTVAATTAASVTPSTTVLTTPSSTISNLTTPRFTTPAAATTPSTTLSFTTPTSTTLPTTPTSPATTPTLPVTTASQTTASQTTASQTTASDTTVSQTTVSPTTAGQTTAVDTTVGPTTAVETTVSPTTGAMTSESATTAEVTTAPTVFTTPASTTRFTTPTTPKFTTPTAAPKTCSCQRVQVTGPEKPHAASLGFYTLQTCDHTTRNVYKHDQRDLYLYYSASNYWAIGLQLDQGVAYIRANDSAMLPTDVNTTWSALTELNGTTYQEDASINVSCACSAIQCQTVEMQSAQASTIIPGQFVRRGESNGRPYYENTQHGVFLYLQQTATCTYWAVGATKDSSSPIMVANDVALTPEEIKATWNVHFKTPTRDEWSRNTNIRLVCLSRST